MKNLKFNSFAIIFAVLCLVSAFSRASTLVEFNYPSLVVEESNGNIYGYFSFMHQINPFSCAFFFYSSNNNESKKRIHGYVSYSTFERRLKESDSDGYLYKSDSGKTWEILFDEIAPDPGCINLGFPFRRGLGDASLMHFKVKKKTPILGIRRIRTNRSIFHDLTGEKFIKRKGFLVSGDVVIVIKKQGDWSYVRFTDPKFTRITTGWIRSKELENPFPNY